LDEGGLVIENPKTFGESEPEKRVYGSSTVCRTRLLNRGARVFG